jgi:hypothetical protein
VSGLFTSCDTITTLSHKSQAITDFSKAMEHPVRGKGMAMGVSGEIALVKMAIS